MQDVEARIEEEKAAAEHEKRFEAWSHDATRELRRLCKPAGLIDDRYNWFKVRFDAGDTPEAAASACEPLSALDDR